mgnify:CR=1 FL=1|tara:strand:- start:189 stop:779 length:591 start_codon:yes stop_codon:yes gene_type:complete
MKALKQINLFKKLKKNNISYMQYIYMVMLYTKGNISEAAIQILTPVLYNRELNKLTEHALATINNIETLFITPKKLKQNELMGDDYKKDISDFINSFPTTKLPNGKYARSNTKNIETNFQWFFENYEYSWETIKQATNMYVSEYRANNYLYMRTALYFIRKNDGTKTVHSDLADYCDKIKNNVSYTPQKYFKTKIL